MADGGSRGGVQAEPVAAVHVDEGLVQVEQVYDTGIDSPNLLRKNESQGVPDERASSRDLLLSMSTM